MTRLALALVITAAGAAAVHQLPKRPVVASAPHVGQPTFRDVPTITSRSARRAPLPAAPLTRGWQRWLDITMYCRTGNRTASGTWPQVGDVAVYDRTIRFGTRLLIAVNVYTVTDWIGHGSDVDIYGGDDAGCEQRALTFGRHHLPVLEVVK